MAVAIVAIGAEFGYNKAQQGIILASFFFGYIVTPILGGTLSDRYGGKAVLATGALVWTVFTVCTPLAAATGLTWLVIARIGLGLGEASDPSSSTLISEKEARWISQQKRLNHIQGQDQEALHRLPDTANQADHVSGGQLEDENEQIRTISSNGEPILYRPLSSIPLEQTTSRHSEGSDESVLRTRSDESPREGVERFVDTPARILSENPLCNTEDESSKSMNMWLAFRNRKRVDRSVHTNTPKAPVPWKQLLKRREVWAIIISQVTKRFKIGIGLR
ncbi:hypothetical protein KI688_007777 [Linnemannia hyalina]|uniref:Major facilitator superfamily (MFS) profile domain-containing protein n=1 Tax=Linnemannia hyalina TaxID=64524 RepID=A0A9P7XGL6_9FUNG|nr:hypothetical protein KI688_007777 [Linnemannia hyalina]